MSDSKTGSSWELEKTKPQVNFSKFRPEEKELTHLKEGI